MAKIVGVIERRDLRVWDTLLVDEREDLVRYEPRSRVTLFSEESNDLNLCNAPNPVGRLPLGQSWRVIGVGLGLHLSDSDLYREVFRRLSFAIWALERPYYEFRAQQFLDAAIAQGMDPNPGFGFAWSQRFERSLNYPPGSAYSVRLQLGNSLRDQLRNAVEGIQAGRQEYRGWFSEIRIYLLGRMSREIPDDELQ